MKGHHLLTLLIGLFLLSCSTGPYVYNTGPKAYEDAKVKITPVIGLNVYSIMIENKTDSEMFIGFERMSVVSPYGESREINPAPNDNHLPPKSRIIIKCGQSSFSNEDPFLPFRNDIWSAEANTGTTYYSEKEIMEANFGMRIRLFIPIVIEGAEKIYDIVFSLDSIYVEDTP